MTRIHKHTSIHTCGTDQLSNTRTIYREKLYCYFCFWKSLKSSKLKFHEKKCKEKHNRDNYHEKSWESLGQQGDPTSTSWRKSTLDSHWKDSCWSWNSNTLATWCEELTHWKRPWCWERLRAGGEGDDRGWDGWMTLVIQWTCVWVNSGT